MQDNLFQSGIYEQGYGMIAKSVMKDTQLSIEAKAIYAYLCSFAGAGQTAFPSVELITSELNISRERFYKHRKQLIEKGYIYVVQTKNEKGHQQKNVYQILNEIKPQSDIATTDSPQSGFPQSDNLQSENPQSENLTSISNSLKSNSLNSNKLISNSAAAANSNKNIYSDVEKVSDMSEEDQQAAGTIPIDLFQDPISNCLGNLCQLSVFQTQDLEFWERDLGKPIANFAIYHAGMRGARGYGLIQDLLTKWSNANVTSLAAAVAYEKWNKKQKARDGNRGKNTGRYAGDRPKSIYD